MFNEVSVFYFFSTDASYGIMSRTLDDSILALQLVQEDVCQQGLFFARKELAPVLDLVVEGGGEAVDVTLPQLPPASRTLALHFAAAGAADEVAGGAAWDGQLPRHGEAGAALHTVLDILHPPLQTLIVFHHCCVVHSLIQ